MNKKYLTTLLAASLLLGSNLFGVKYAISGQEQELIVVTPDEMRWQDTPTEYHPASKQRLIATLFGNTNQPGPYVITGRVATGTVQKPRALSHDIFSYVVAGSDVVTITDINGDTKELVRPTGTFIYIPANVSHFMDVKTAETFIEWGNGPRTYTVKESTLNEGQQAAVPGTAVSETATSAATDAVTAEEAPKATPEMAGEKEEPVARKEMRILTPEMLVWKPSHPKYETSTSREEAILFGDPEKSERYALMIKDTEKAERRLHVFGKDRYYYLISGGIDIEWIDAQGNTHKVSASNGDFILVPADVKVQSLINDLPYQIIEWGEGPRTSSVAEDSLKSAPNEVRVIHSKDIAWKSSHPKYELSASRAEAVIFGDPDKAGPYVLLGKILEYQEHRPAYIMENDRYYYVIAGEWSGEWINAQGTPQKVSASTGDVFVQPAGGIMINQKIDAPLIFLEWGEGPRSHKLVENPIK